LLRESKVRRWNYTDEQAGHARKGSFRLQVRRARKSGGANSGRSFGLDKKIRPPWGETLKKNSRKGSSPTPKDELGRGSQRVKKYLGATSWGQEAIRQLRKDDPGSYLANVVCRRKKKPSQNGVGRIQKGIGGVSDAGVQKLGEGLRSFATQNETSKRRFLENESAERRLRGRKLLSDHYWL